MLTSAMSVGLCGLVTHAHIGTQDLARWHLSIYEHDIAVNGIKVHVDLLRSSQVIILAIMSLMQTCLPSACNGVGFPVCILQICAAASTDTVFQICDLCILSASRSSL